MKENFIRLAHQAELLKRKFHIAPIFGGKIRNCIYDVPEFAVWKEELQEELQNLYDNTGDEYIYSVLVQVKETFDGQLDDGKFLSIVNSLKTINENINSYYPERSIIMPKEPKLFISHSSLDKEYVKSFIELLEDIGLDERQIFCSSLPEYGVKLDSDIYQTLKEEFQKYELHVVFLLSENYYTSAACLNEMGAAWVLQKKYTTILLPGFEYKQVKGAVDPRRISIKLDGDMDELKARLGELNKNLTEEFSLPTMGAAKWERKRNEFLENIDQLTSR